MKHFPYLISLVVLSAIAWFVQVQPGQTADEADRAAAIKLYQALTPEQKKMVVQPADSKDRYAEIFPTTKRPGLSFAQLTAEQKDLVEKMIRSMTSDYGAERCVEVLKQTGDGGRYVTFYGEPSANAPFAWRVATHHLTLLYAKYGDKDADEFGPILLGGNPVKTLWDEEDKILVKFYASLTAEETKAIQGKGKSNSGAPIDSNAMKIANLNATARGLARQLLAQRLAVFSNDRRVVLDKMLERQGGVDSLQVAIWGDASKGRADGGNYHWRIGSPSFVCDWQSLGKEHIHMTLRARIKS